MRPRLLDLYCGAGGSAVGYSRAGFDIVGVDIVPQKHYPFPCVCDDALAYVRRHGCEFDAIHASPPCKKWSRVTQRPSNHDDLITPTRTELALLGRPYVIENVPDAPLVDPVMLCGTMFPGLKVYRHRLFESNVFIPQPRHPAHVQRFARAGRGANSDGWLSVAGNFKDVAQARVAMGIDWMNRNEMAQAIPPAYAEYVGSFLLKGLA